VISSGRWRRQGRARSPFVEAVGAFRFAPVQEPDFHTQHGSRNLKPETWNLKHVGEAMIEGYHFGSITIDGKHYQADVKIIGKRVVADWWRQQGHVLDAFDVDDILSARPEYLVVGRGSPGNMAVAENLRESLAAVGIELIDEPTSRAVKTFNRLRAEGKRVAGAFHLTC
jgi:hypothetical protein